MFVVRQGPGVGHDLARKPDRCSRLAASNPILPVLSVTGTPSPPSATIRRIGSDYTHSLYR